MFHMKRAGRLFTALFLAALLTFGLVSSALAAEVKPTIGNIRFLTTEDQPPEGGAFPWWATYHLTMDWDATSYQNTLKNGDYFVVNLPDEIRLPPPGDPSLTFPLYDSDNKIIANAVITPNPPENKGGKIKITYT